MFIESAFYKMPELLLNEKVSNIYEASVRNILSLSFLLEFNSRNTSNPMERIKLEKEYANMRKRKFKCDLFLDLEGLYDKVRHAHLGLSEKNWFEIKYFGGKGRSKGSVAKTGNVGKILNDILRLCLCIKELQGNIRENERFLICVFNDQPEKYLPKLKKDLWLNQMLESGIRNIAIDFKSLQNSSKKRIKFQIPYNLFKIKLSIDTKSFYPIGKSENLNFYGFLIKIFGFELQIDDIILKYSDFGSWDKKKVDLFDRIRKKLNF